MKPVIERVLDRVVRIPFSGCWIFTGATNNFGYGIIGAGGRNESNERVHRVTYRHFCGDIPEGMFVCHACDVPSCCNPDHLFLGTNRDNVNDMINKRRNSPPPRNPHVVGSAHPSSKLTEQQVLLIRETYAKGIGTQQEIANAYGVARQTISKIVNNLRFKHV